MSSINDIINITVVNGSTPVTQQGFGTAMLIAKCCFMPDKFMVFKNTDEFRALYLGTDQNVGGVDGGTKTFQQDLFTTLDSGFAQNPQQIAICRRDSSYGCTPVLAATTVYSAGFSWYDTNGQLKTDTATFTSSGTTPVDKDIIDGLQADIATKTALAAVVQATKISGTDPAPVGLKFAKATGSTTFFSINAISASLSNLPQQIPIQSCVDAYNDVLAYPGAVQNFYGVSAHSTINGVDDLVASDIVAIGTVVESSKKMFIYASHDQNNMNQSSTISTTYLAKNATLNRTAIMQKAFTNQTQSSSLSWLTYVLSLPAGSANFAYKQLSTVPAVVLSSSQVSAIFFNNGNTYEAIGGVNVTRYGTAAGGQYLDIELGLDFIVARLSEAWFSLLVNTPKVPYTDLGIAKFENEARGIMAIAVQETIVETWNIIVPKAASVPQNDKASRVLNNVAINCVLQGAINKVNATIYFTL